MQKSPGRLSKLEIARIEEQRGDYIHSGRFWLTVLYNGTYLRHELVDSQTFFVFFMSGVLR